MKPKAFIFDFFGVMCPDVAGDWFKKNIPGGTLEVQSEYLKEADSGLVDGKEAFKNIAKAVGRDVDELSENWYSAAIVSKEMVEIVLELKKKYKVAVCSNAPKDFFYTVLKQNNIEELFDVLVISSEVGYMKPHREIFEITIQKLGIPKEEIIFFDDRQKNIDGGKSVGLDSVLFTSPSQLQKYLQNEGFAY